ncbi:Phosphotransferase enzyme, partial [Mortierella sp. AM989]
ENDGTFFIGSIVHNNFFLDGRADVDMDRGLWLTTRDYLVALLRSEVDYLKSKYGAALDGIGGNGRDNGENDEDYEEELEKARDVLETTSKLETIIPSFLPNNPTLERFCLHHCDLESRNIMIQGTAISGIIDWESSSACPVWPYARCPTFIAGRGHDVEETDAVNWDDPEEFEQVFHETQLRRFFRSEISKRDLAFGVAMHEGSKVQMFEDQVILTREYPRHVKRWINHLRSGSEGWDEDLSA